MRNRDWIRSKPDKLWWDKKRKEVMVNNTLNFDILSMIIAIIIKPKRDSQKYKNEQMWPYLMSFFEDDILIKVIELK